jgi:hypothetical protein
MPWTYVPLDELGSLTQGYERSYTHRLDNVSVKSDASQSLLNEIDEWDDFLDAVKAFGNLGRDPASFMPPTKRARYLASESSDLIVLKKTPFNLACLREPEVGSDSGTLPPYVSLEMTIRRKC